MTPSIPCSKEAFPVLLVAFLAWPLYRLLEWRRRLSHIRRTLPAIGILLHHGAVLRMLFPTKWQTYHLDWQFQNRKEFEFSEEGPGFLALVPLFGDVTVFCFDAEAIMEVSSNPARFPKDLKLYSTFPRSLETNFLFSS